LAYARAAEKGSTLKNDETGEAFHVSRLPRSGLIAPPGRSQATLANRESQSVASSAPVLPALYPAPISVSSSLLAHHDFGHPLLAIAFEHDALTFFPETRLIGHGVRLATIQLNEFRHPRYRVIPNILEKNCWNLSKAFLEKCACSFELCLPSFTMQLLNHDQRRSRADNGRCPVLRESVRKSLAAALA
jgi:hypothetical protein